MKKSVYYLVTLIAVAIVFNSCSKEEDFDQALLTGKWKSGTLYEKYQADGNGYTWDEGDGVYEADAQRFTWTLVKADLTQIHIMEIGGNVPRYYTVTELTATSLKYEDRLANPVKVYSFTKVSK